MSDRLTREQQIAAVDAYLAGFAKARGIPLAEVREEWNERAAIREYSGALKHRRNAELHAVGDTTEGFTQRRGMPKR